MIKFRKKIIKVINYLTKNIFNIFNSLLTLIFINQNNVEIFLIINFWKNVFDYNLNKLLYNDLIIIKVYL